MNEKLQVLLAEMRADDLKARGEIEDKWLLPRSLHPDSAQFLSLIVHAVNARAVLEIGTSVGFSTLYLAEAVSEIGGHVTTLEMLPAKYDSARANITRSGFTSSVTQHLGDALDLLPKLPGPWDLIFLDAEKEIYYDAWHLFRDNVSPGGIVIADNLLSHADDLQSYRQAILDDSRYETMTLPIGQGLELSCRRR